MTKEEILDKKFKMESTEHDTKVFMYDALDAMDEYAKSVNLEVLNVLKNARQNMQWMWENLHKEHSADHFNIPANAISEVEQLINKIENGNK